jgi:hypothetical protein
LVFLSQIINIATPKIPLSRQANLLIRRDVRNQYREAIAQGLTFYFSFTSAC